MDVAKNVAFKIVTAWRWWSRVLWLWVGFLVGRQSTAGGSLWALAFSVMFLALAGLAMPKLLERLEDP